MRARTSHARLFHVPSPLAAAAALALCAAVSAPAPAGALFTHALVIPTTGGTIDIELADMDGDLDLDIVVLDDFLSGGGDNGFIRVFLNDGAGGFPSAATTPLPPPSFSLENAFADLTLGDFDGDGDTDAAYIGTTSQLTVLTNAGDGSFSAVTPTGIAAVFNGLSAFLAAGNVDGDTDHDIVFGLPGTLARSLGASGFDDEVFTQDSNPSNVALLDLNHDTHPDVALGFRTYLNNGAGAFTLAGGFPGAGARVCAFADFDEDNDVDCACARALTLIGSRVSIGLGDGAGDMPGALDIMLEYFPRRIVRAEIDGDGDVDLIVTRQRVNCCDFATQFDVFMGRGDGTFQNRRSFALAHGEGLAAGDLNGDGLDDLVVGSGDVFSPSDGVHILLNAGVGEIAEADLDLDGGVGGADLAQLLGAWGMCSASPAPCAADLNGDGAVNTADLALLLGEWG